MSALAKRVLHSRSGATAIEYALMAALVAAALATALGLLGTRLAALFAATAALFP